MARIIISALVIISSIVSRFLGNRKLHCISLIYVSFLCTNIYSFNIYYKN